MDLSTENTMRERISASRWRFWLLLGANRWLLAGILGACVFFAFVVLGVLDFPTLRTTMETTDPVDTIFQGLVGAIVTGTTLVVSINQLVLSQEIGPLGEQRARMDTAMDFRQNTDELFGSISPAKPSLFLQQIIETARDRAAAMKSAVDDSENTEMRENVGTYVDDLVENAETAIDELDEATFGTFDVLMAALDYNYARKMHDLRRLGEKYEDDLSDEQRRTFRETLEALTMFGPAREHIKTFYFQWALVKLSRAILTAAVPALVVAGGMVVFVDATSFPGQLFGTDYMIWVVSLAFTIAVMPFLLFVSYILRIATVAKQTLAMGPMVLRNSESPSDE